MSPTSTCSRTPDERILAVHPDGALTEIESTLREDAQRRLAPGDGAPST